MTLTAFVLILASLLLHSLWHFLCKSSGRSSMSFFAIFSTSLLLTVFPLGCCSGILFDLPFDVLKYAFAGGALGVLCDIGLMLAYKYCDISLAYPMARALPVFLTMAITGFFGWGKTLSPWAVAGMMIIFTGCVCMAMTGGGSEMTWREKLSSMRKGLWGILIAAAGTTGYTVVDSFGIGEIMALAPESNTVLKAAAYSTCREVVAAPSLWICAMLCRLSGREKGVLESLVKSYHPYVAGFSAAMAYLLVLVAMFFVTNVSFVQAFRQLSLPVSALLGFIILKEKVSSLRLTALLFIMAGLMISVL